MAKRARPDGWFARPTGPAGPGSPADEAAQVASRLSAPSSGTTSAGLPVRVPRAHLVPGAFGGGGEPKSSTRDSPPPPRRSPEEVGGRLADYHGGVRRGRRSDPE